jgi:hypothetical protein
MKAIKQHLSEKNPERLNDFETGAQAFAKKIVGNFKDFEFVSLNVHTSKLSPMIWLMYSTLASR